MPGRGRTCEQVGQREEGSEAGCYAGSVEEKKTAKQEKGNEKEKSQWGMRILGAGVPLDGRRKL